MAAATLVAVELLAGEGVRLRPWAPGDEGALAREANHREVWRNLKDRFPHPYGPVDAVVWIAMAGAIEPSPHLCIEVDGAVVGGIGWDRGQDVFARTGEVGYWLGPSHWGKGVATRALVAFTAHVLESTDVVRLEAGVFAWNAASARVLEKAGYHLESRQRSAVCKDGQVTDRLLYVRLR
ncbi:MAG: GNAT family N-acetyltransferase [Planctomycetaceae bacterium]|nr:GNAT family N-acetyltransferase [Planctomycetaceae bacterium]